VFIASLILFSKGTTVHLLKQRSKAVPQERKRRKIDLYASPALFLQEFEEHK